MTRELRNIDVQFVSFVDKAANQKKFFLTKSEKQPNFTKDVRIVKDANDPKKLVYGLVYEPNVEDAHGDFANEESIEKAAHDFLTKYRQIDTQHDFEAGAGEVVESYIAPADLTIGEEVITKGSWVLVTKATDEIWESIQKGEYTGYSLAGIAETIEKADTTEDGAVKSFMKHMKAFFVGEKDTVTKGAVADKYERDRRRREFWAAQDALNSVIFNWDTWDGEVETDETKIREALQDFVDITQQVLIEGNVLKALGKPPEEVQKSRNEGEEDNMKAEDIQKAVEAALEPVTQRLDALEKEAEPQEPTKEENVAEQVQDAVAKALEPVAKRLDVIEKARGISKQEEEQTPVQKSEGPAYGKYFG